MDSAPVPTATTAEAFLERLAARGVEYVFANAGTDFAPIIEAVARNGTTARFPRFVTVPHENLAMAMAAGYYRTTGKIAAVMVHVTVGTGNTVCQLMNMARDRVPVFLCAGRTPITETGHIGSRSRQIHWGQESFDQGGMVREFVKWDYELRESQPVGAIVDRGLDIAMSEPRGPVYVCLPREVLANPATPMRRANVRPLGVPAAAPSRAVVAEAAKWLAAAQSPLIITSAAGRSPAAVAALAALADDHAIAVTPFAATDMNLPTAHPMNLGAPPDNNPHLKAADVVVVVSSGVPWIPQAATPAPGAKVIHIDVDPLQTRQPFREYEADLLIAGEPAVALDMLHEALGKGRKPHEERRKKIAAAREQAQSAARAMVDKVKEQTPIHPAWLTKCVNDAKAADAIVVNELGVATARLDFEQPMSLVEVSPAGGLGGGLGLALGAKMGAPKREVIVVVGDGSYMFGDPVPYHFVQRAENLPTLTIVANNHAWYAVRMSTLAMYPDGAAAKANTMPLQELNPSPAFEKVGECCGGYAESVTSPAELPAAIARALAKVRAGVPALLNVHTQAGRL